ncbi:MAG: recombination regulator RecX [Acidobacteria bacterium]|nr:recombination regulator RecX [Acidobacteriota bacterium]
MWKKWKEIKDDSERTIKDVEKSRTRTFDRAVNLLTYKPRSIKELRERLLEKDWTNEAIVTETIEKLEKYGYLNDAQFAKDFAASKLRQKPIGKRVLKQKLAQRKLGKETVEEAVEKAFENWNGMDRINKNEEIGKRVKFNPFSYLIYLLTLGMSFFGTVMSFFASFLNVRNSLERRCFFNSFSVFVFI